ncbi:MAG: SAM-dependent methyltransferase [Treponema sp.]|nr:SAM-dependent methyltransferase [Treponema sp.]
MAVSFQKLNGRAFLAFPEKSGFLESELQGRFGISPVADKIYGDLYYYSKDSLRSRKFSERASKVVPYFACTVMEEPFILHFDSIGEAACELKKIQRNWAPYQYTCFRRAQLIQEKLPYINLKERKFPVKIPESPIGLYTLIDEHTMIASAKTTSFLPAGKITWVEDHENPPSRAYLKIQESLTLFNLFFKEELPHTGQKCFEAGACPGGWTWVLAGLGAEVFAVDRAELVPSLMENPLVKFQAHDAFTLKPEDIGKVDWVFSDVICYPERLLEWIKKWMESGLTHNIICTIKMQGEIDWQMIDEKFAVIPNSRIVHLNYNKHELTILIKC